MRRNMLWKNCHGAALTEAGDANYDVTPSDSIVLVAPTADRVVTTPDIDTFPSGKPLVIGNIGDAGIVTVSPSAGTIGGLASVTLKPSEILVITAPSSGSDATIEGQADGIAGWVELTDAHLKAGSALNTPDFDPQLLGGTASYDDGLGGWQFSGTDKATLSGADDACGWFLDTVANVLDSSFTWDGTRTVEFKIVPDATTPTDQSTRIHVGTCEASATGLATSAAAGINLVGNGVGAWTGGVTVGNTADGGHGTLTTGMRGMVVPFGSDSANTRLEVVGRAVNDSGLYAQVSSTENVNEASSRLWVGFTYRTSGNVAKTSDRVRIYARVRNLWP